MQLYSSFSGVVSSRSSSYVGRSLQVPPASRGCVAPAPSCVVGVRSEIADLWQLLGGRGLPGGEEVLKNESKSKVLFGAVKEEAVPQEKIVEESEAPARVDEDAEAQGFEKEMMGLTGGFPGGETGLQRFVATSNNAIPQRTVQPLPQQRPRAPPPPLLMPGMTVIVKNPRHSFYMYSGIVQRVSDGRVGVLFEGGIWDKLQTFYLEDLERTSTGPPMINPKSAILLQRKPPAPPR